MKVTEATVLETPARVSVERVLLFRLPFGLVNWCQGEELHVVIASLRGRFGSDVHHTAALRATKNSDNAGETPVNI